MKNKNSSSGSKAISKIEKAKSLFEILPPDASSEQSREERLMKRSIRGVKGILKPKIDNNVDEAIDLSRAERAKEISTRLDEKNQQ